MPGRDIRCSWAENASRARAICAESPEVDLLIVERRLPDADGLGLIAALKLDCPAAEGIVLGDDLELEHAIEAVGQGVFACVREPFLPATLLQSADAALAKVELMRDREQLRTELEASERRHREVVEALPAFVLASDGDGRISFWNHRLEELTGRSREQILGTAASEIIGSGGDRRLGTRDGVTRLVRWQLSKAIGTDGKEMTYALGTDVTEERAMLRRTLRAERLAAVGTLATGLAHEIRNPLNSATLQLQVLRRRIRRDDRGQETLLPIVDTVDGEIHRLERLVSDFLAFSQPHPLQLENTLVSALVESIAERVRPDAEKAGVSLRIEKGSPEEPVDADRERIQQVLLNLTRNAIEAMPEGGVLTLRVHAADHEGFVAVEVEDTGVGIPDHAPAFDAFFTTKQGGTGLGLAIVHRVVEDHGGSVQYESKPGSTRFTLELPASMQP